MITTEDASWSSWRMEVSSLPIGKALVLLELDVFYVSAIKNVGQYSKDLIMASSVSSLAESSLARICIIVPVSPHITCTVGPPSFPTCTGLLVMERCHKLSRVRQRCGKTPLSSTKNQSPDFVGYMVMFQSNNALVKSSQMNILLGLSDQLAEDACVKTTREDLDGTLN